MNRRNKTSKSGGNLKRIIGITAISLAFVLVFGGLAALTMRVEKGGWKDWFKTQPTTKQEETPKEGTSQEPQAEAGHKLRLTTSQVTSRSANGTTKVVTGAYIINVTSDIDIKNCLVDWELGYADGTAATNLHTYVTLEPLQTATAGSLASAKLTSIMPWNKQLKVTAKLHDKPTVQTSIVIDCVKKLTTEGVSGVAETGSNDFGDTFDLSIPVRWSNGTVEGNYDVEKVKLDLDPNFIYCLRSKLNFNVEIDTYVELTYRMTLTAKTVVVQGKLLFVIEGTTIDISWFFPKWSTYTDNQRNAIRYAWFHGYSDSSEYNFSLNGNLKVYIKCSYKYSGVEVGRFDNYLGVAGYNGWLSGDCEGSDISPEQLNTANNNLVFY